MPSFTRPGTSVIDYNAVTGDSITSAAQKTDLAINDLYTQIVDGTALAKGIVQLGTGAANAAAGNHAHTGTYQPADATLTAVAAVYTAADRVPYATAADTLAEMTVTAAGRAILDDADAATQRTTLGLGSAALLTAGTAANNAVQLNASAQLPAVDGSQLTNLKNLASPASTGVFTLSGGQIAFPAAQNASSDANTLDDYEEGTWTPTIAGSTTAGSHTYLSQIGRYIKIGKMVHIQFRVDMSAKDAAMAGSYLYLSGLPFTSVNSNAFTGCFCSYWGGWAAPEVAIGLQHQANNPYAYITLFPAAASSPAYATPAAVTNNTLLAGSYTYEATA